MINKKGSLMKIVLKIFFIQSWVKHLKSFQRFTTISLDHKWNGIRFYHQKVNLRVPLRVTEPLKTYDLRKIRNYKKIPEMSGFDGKYAADHPKAKF